MSDSTNNKSDALMTACDEAFGLHPEDVVAPIKGGADICHWLDEIFKTIEEEAEKNGPVSHFRIKHLANAGAYLASDYANYLGCQHEDMAANLAKVGIKIGGEK